jgi:superfamily II DNA/RNA helicase
MVCTNTREQCDKLAKELNEKGYECVIYRGEMDKNERRMNLKKFREGKVNLLVSTDLGGRGLDLESVGRVINYHLPKEKENYIHRVGRTARAGRKGLVINLVTERDQRLICKLEGKALPPFNKRTPKGDKPTALSKPLSKAPAKAFKKKG